MGCIKTESIVILTSTERLHHRKRQVDIVGEKRGERDIPYNACRDWVLKRMLVARQACCKDTNLRRKATCRQSFRRRLACRGRLISPPHHHTPHNKQKARVARAQETTINAETKAGEIDRWWAQDAKHKGDLRQAKNLRTSSQAVRYGIAKPQKSASTRCWQGGETATILRR